MKRYTVASVRERLAEALDAVDLGVPVIIERRGVRYRLAREDVKRVARRRKPRIEIRDRAVAQGQWTWSSSRDGLRFRANRT